MSNVLDPFAEEAGADEITAEELTLLDNSLFDFVRSSNAAAAWLIFSLIWGCLQAGGMYGWYVALIDILSAV